MTGQSICGLDRLLAQEGKGVKETLKIVLQNANSGATFLSMTLID